MSKVQRQIVPQEYIVMNKQKKNVFNEEKNKQIQGVVQVGEILTNKTAFNA